MTAVAGFLMSKGLEANIGIYAEAVKGFLTKAYEGTAVYGADLIASAKAPAEPVALIAQPADHTDAGGMMV